MNAIDDENTPVETINTLISAIAVRYDAAQTLSDGAQARARANIGAAQKDASLDGYLFPGSVVTLSDLIAQVRNIVSILGGAAEAVNYALAGNGAIVTASATNSGVTNLNNGSRSYNAGYWNGSDGETLTVDFGAVRNISVVDLYSVTNSEQSRPEEENGYSIFGAEIDAFVGGAWQPVGSFTGNIKTCVTVPFTAVAATKIRIKNLVGSQYAVRLAEIEVY